MIPNPAYNNQVLVGYMFGNSANKNRAVIRAKMASESEGS